MIPAELKIRRIDARRDDTRAAIDEFASDLAPRGTWSAKPAGERRSKFLAKP